MPDRWDDYVDVAERIRLFYERYPEGSLQTGERPQVMEFGGEKRYVVYHARAYRTADDARPAEGWAWEPIPGPTAFTRDSELMNAETSAWGRAIIAAGIPSKRVASAQEARARQDLVEIEEENRGKVEKLRSLLLEEGLEPDFVEGQLNSKRAELGGVLPDQYLARQIAYAEKRLTSAKGER